MPKMVEHEGYIIQSTPQYQADWEKWRVCIVISLKDPQGARSREFSPQVLYATEQEADVHATTFGKRLIDGKVEGQSVTDMKTDDRRAMPRVRVQFRATFSASPTLEGTGFLLDLSLRGCRIESHVTMKPGETWELRIYAPDIEWPLMIQGASVQWVSGQTFGLAFFQVTTTEQERLGQVVKDLIDGGARAEQTSG